MAATILVILISYPTPGEDIGERFAGLVSAQSRALEQYREHLTRAKDAKSQQDAADAYLAKVSANTRAVLDLVKDQPDDPITLEALHFVIRTARAGPGTESFEAVAILRKNFVNANDIGKVCQSLFYFYQHKDVETFLREVAINHPRHEDRGLASYALANYLLYNASTLERMRQDPNLIREFYDGAPARLGINPNPPGEDPLRLRSEALAMLRIVLQDFSDVPVGSKSLGELASKKLAYFDVARLGEVFPNIMGQDVDGNEFQLKDFRGRVVVLTFSGNWCGPCRGMYASERELVASLKDEQFVLLSVDTDQSKETLKDSIGKGEITWRCWWDRGVHGPITEALGVAEFPTIFVLDRKGVLRFKNIKNNKLNECVKQLINDK